MSIIDETLSKAVETLGDLPPSSWNGWLMFFMREIEKEHSRSLEHNSEVLKRAGVKTPDLPAFAQPSMREIVQTMIDDLRYWQTTGKF